MKLSVKKIFEKKTAKNKLIFVIGIAGILLIALSEIIPSKTDEIDLSEQDEVITFEDALSYKESLEKQLSKIISHIKGVGDVEVMITVSSTAEYLYAEQSDIERQTDSGSESIKKQGEIIISELSGDKQPTVRMINAPQIAGATVVCGGAENSQTKERVINAVSAALGIPSSKISVEPAK